MRNRKQILVLLAVAILCICMCLTACGKNNKTANVKDGKTTSQNQTGKKDTNSDKNTSKDSGQKQNQPKVVYQDNGSGVEIIENFDQPEPAAQSPAEGKSAEKKQQEGTKPAEEQGTSPEKEEPAPAKQLSSTAQEYADYCAMSTDEQYAYYKKFASADEFFNWYNAAKAEYDKENQAIVIEPGEVIDLGN